VVVRGYRNEIWDLPDNLRREMGKGWAIAHYSEAVFLSTSRRRDLTAATAEASTHPATMPCVGSVSTVTSAVAHPKNASTPLKWKEEKWCRCRRKNLKETTERTRGAREIKSLTLRDCFAF